MKPMLILFASLIALAPTCFGYVPHRQSILGRLVRSHGKGNFILEQDVIFQTHTEPLVVHERWVISSSENMRLTATSGVATNTAGNSTNRVAQAGESVRFDIVYKNGKRTTNESGNLQAGPISPEFIEGFFHSRTVHAFEAELLKAKVADRDSLRERPKARKIDEIEHSPDPELRLGRDAGRVTWILGQPSPAQGPLNPEVWIAQDEFTLRKIRFPSEAEVSADRDSIYARTLHFPRERKVSWNGNSALIRVVSVRAVTPAQISGLLDPASIVTVNKGRPTHLPDGEQIKEFYSRFR